MQIDLDASLTLLAVVRHGSFDAAARELGLTPSAVSQRVRALEQRTGQVLLTRSRPVATTDAGTVLVRLATQLELLSGEAAAELDGRQGDQHRSLTVATNGDSLAGWLLPVVAEVQQRHRISLELLRDDEFHSAELLRQGRVVAAVTADPVVVQGCRVVPLGAARYRAMASPAWVERWWGRGEAALAEAPMVVFDQRDPLQHRVLAERGPAGARPSVTAIPSSWDFQRAVELGIGWGMVPELTLPEARGQLIPLWPDAAVDVHLHWAHWRLGSPALDALTEAVVRRARDVLVQPG